MSDGDLCQHIVLLRSHQPTERMRQGQSGASQTDLTKQTISILIHTPRCAPTAQVTGSHPAKPMQIPEKDQLLRSQVHFG